MAGAEIGQRQLPNVTADLGGGPMEMDRSKSIQSKRKRTDPIH